MAERQASADKSGAIGAVLMVCLGSAALLYSSDFSDLGAVFPRGIGGLLVVLGLAYLAMVLLGRTQARPALEGSNARRLGVAAVLLAWAYALPILGFLLASALGFGLLLLLAQHERWTLRTAVLYSGAGGVILLGLYALFKLALKVPLP